MSHRHRLLAAVVALLLLAAALRFHRLGAQSFWNDEGNSARLSERSIPAIVEGTASDVHPPLYYVLLRGWRELAGETEFGLRALSAFAGVLTVAAVSALSRATGVRVGLRPAPTSTPTTEGLPAQHVPPPALREARGQPQSANPQMRPPRGGLFASENANSATRHSTLAALLFAATSPVLVYYSQETRMYALLALLAALSTWALLVWLGGGGRRWAVTYVALAAAGLYTHYFFPAVMAAQALVVLLGSWGRKRDAEGEKRDAEKRGEKTRRDAEEESFTLPPRPSLLSSAPLRVPLLFLLMATTSVALYLPWLPIFLRQVGGREGAQPPLLAFLAGSWRWLVLGSTTGPGEATWALIAAVVLATPGLAVGRRRSAVALVLLMVPLALMYLAGATDPAFFKFMLVAVPFLCLLMGLGWAVPRRWLWLPGLLTALVLAGSAVSLVNLYANPAYARADYRSMAARIAADDRNVGVILVAPNQWEVFTYYHRDGAPVYPLPLGQPDPALLQPELVRLAAAHERLYVLYWGEGQRDPQGVIERWLDAHTFKASEEWVGDVRLAVYAIAPATTVAPTPSGATFAALDGETITLREYTVWPVAARAGDVISVRLVWSADAAPARPYKVFLHLLAGDGRLVAQRDGEPGGGSRPATGWAAGESVVDNHGLLLPPDLSPDEYTLRLGLYDALDPTARLPVNGGDSLSLGAIVVEEQKRDTE